MTITPRYFATLAFSMAFLAPGCLGQTDPVTIAGIHTDDGPTEVPKVDGCPLFGGTLSRNLVNLVDKNVPIEWSVEEKKEKNIKWVADLGTNSYSGPILAGGKIFIGTNNGSLRDPKIKEKNRAVLMCFNEADGKFLWQYTHLLSGDDCFSQVRDLGVGLVSTPHVEGNRLYFTLPDSIVVCADANDGKVLWEYDMRKELKIFPTDCTACSPLVAGDLVFVVTGNGFDREGKHTQPNAPSFIAVNKKTGKLAWQSNLPGDQVFEGQWSNPAYAVIQGKPQVIFPGGDAGLYSFEPTTGKLIWEFHSYPKRIFAAKAKLSDKKDAVRNYFVSTPVIHDNKVFIGLGVDPDHVPLKDMKDSYFLCIDATKTGDVSPGKSLDPRKADNKNSALLWSFGGSLKEEPKEGRKAIFDKTISTCAIHDGLVYIAEIGGYVHCLDERTGEKYWTYDSLNGFWGSTYYVDGKVYIGTENGEMQIMQAGKQLKVLAKVDMGEGMHTTPVVNAGILFVPTSSKLYAIAEKK